ncbi:hypothetical protein ACFPK1_29270 [Actinomycetospora rhizophila]|uniref:Uncharacterized protein n=1 Tax=Actinomycetospora rhizophila TaxID=1416876 RepID=A0ABV9ZPZ9_9PSEU
MSPWITLIGTLLGVVLGGGITFLNNIRQRKWAVEDRDKAIIEAQQKWRREAGEDRASALRDERRATYAKMLRALDEAYRQNNLARTKMDHGLLSSRGDEAVEAVGSINEAGTTLAEVEIIGPKSVSDATHSALQVVMYIATLLAKKEPQVDEMASAGDLMKIKRKEMVEAMRTALSASYDAELPRAGS